MIVRWPGVVEPGSETNHVSALWDVAPTFLELGGAPPVSNLDGLSFAPTLRGDSQEAHDYLYWEFHPSYYHDQVWKQAVRMGDWKGVRLTGLEPSESSIELYDLANDPAELMNVASGHSDVTSHLLQLMDQAHDPSELFPFPGEKP